MPSRAARGLRPVAVAAPDRPSTGAWSPDSWRTKKALQMPHYEDDAKLQAAVAELRRCPPLVFAGEVRPCGRHPTRDGAATPQGGCQHGRR